METMYSKFPPTLHAFLSVILEFQNFFKFALKYEILFYAETSFVTFDTLGRAQIWRGCRTQAQHLDVSRERYFTFKKKNLTSSYTKELIMRGHMAVIVKKESESMTI